MSQEEWYTVEVQALDWIVVLNKLINKFDKDGKEARVDISQTGVATYLLRRDLIPAAALAAALGVTAEAVEKAPSIVLKPFRKMAGWQTPTVDYYGQA